MIPRTLLVAPGDFAGPLSAARAATAIAAGLRDAGLPEPDLCPILDAHPAGDPRALLDALQFDPRMRQARAVVVGERRLDPHTLPGSVLFEIATRARQGGVPAYAIAGENALSAFDARVLDLQIVLEAGTARGLQAAARRLAELV
jgi:glycerate kinase